MLKTNQKIHQITYSDGQNPSPLDQLTEFSITGQRQKLRDQMLADMFVLKNIAIMGQWTTIYGAPNSGKTLIANWLLKEAILSNEVDGEMVFYINADDNFRGLVEKIELAELWGMHMIAPNHNGFMINQVSEIMARMADDGSARGAVIVLDTLKKFTDLMDKRMSTDFGIIARGFVSAGGTLIALAHTNKNPNSDGKAQYSGTSDIVDDSDCCFVIDSVSVDEKSDVTNYTLEFNNIKARGDVATKLGFSFEKKSGQQYSELIESVEWLDKNHINEILEQTNLKKELEEDTELIITIQELIKNGTSTKDKIVKNSHSQTGESTARIKKVLARRTGDDYDLGHRWVKKIEAHNRHVYSVLPTP